MEVQEHGVRGQTCISHPPEPLVPLVTVRGNAHQVGQLPTYNTCLYGQEGRVAGVELAVRENVGVDVHFDYIGRAQVARIAGHLRVTEPVVRERRLVGRVAPVARVHVRLLRAAKVVVIQGAVLRAVGWVLGDLGVPYLYDRSRREPGYVDATHTRRVVAEVDDLLTSVRSEAIDGDWRVRAGLGDVRDRGKVHLAVRAANDDRLARDGSPALARVVRLAVVYRIGDVRSTVHRPGVVRDNALEAAVRVADVENGPEDSGGGVRDGRGDIPVRIDARVSPADSEKNIDGRRTSDVVGDVIHGIRHADLVICPSGIQGDGRVGYSVQVRTIDVDTGVPETRCEKNRLLYRYCRDEERFV